MALGSQNTWIRRTWIQPWDKGDEMGDLMLPPRAYDQLLTPISSVAFGDVISFFQSYLDHELSSVVPYDMARDHFQESGGRRHGDQNPNPPIPGPAQDEA